jgi:hypothetical protein
MRRAWISGVALLLAALAVVLWSLAGGEGPAEVVGVSGAVEFGEGTDASGRPPGGLELSPISSGEREPEISPLEALAARGSTGVEADSTGAPGSDPGSLAVQALFAGDGGPAAGEVVLLRWTSGPSTEID